jgi:hypothetical protein
MTKSILAFLAAVLLLAGCKSQQSQKLGAEITLKENTKVSEILANPNSYLGKTVLVQGNVLDVCTEAGCWMDIAGDVANQKIKIKVKDGDIVFPGAKGKSALVEGVVYSIELDKEEAKEYYKHMAEDAGKPFDSTSVIGPMTIYQIKGVGAEITM